LKIFGYATKKTSETHEVTGEDKRRVYHPVLSVFDIAQTDLMEGHQDHSMLAHRLVGGDEQGLLDAVTAYLTGTTWSVIRESISGAHGYTTTDESRRVVIDSRLGPVMAARTALHEAAHITLGHVEDP
jgi:hypothetical protein